MVLKPKNWIKHHVEWTQSGSNKVFNPAGLGMVWCEYQKFDDNTKVGAAQKWNKL